MKKHLLFTAGRAGTLFILLYLPITVSAAETGWGTSYSDFMKEKSSADKSEFSPVDKPGYRHRILDYITGINPDIIKKIKIVRINSVPVRDYLFVGNRLYSIRENWKRIPGNKEKALFARLKKKYGNPRLKEDGNLKIYSFKKNRTKIIYYRTAFHDGTSKSSVYYYTTRLFRMMLMGGE